MVDADMSCRVWSVTWCGLDQHWTMSPSLHVGCIAASCSRCGYGITRDASLDDGIGCIIHQRWMRYIKGGCVITQWSATSTVSATLEAVKDYQTQLYRIEPEETLELSFPLFFFLWKLRRTDPWCSQLSNQEMHRSVILYSLGKCLKRVSLQWRNMGDMASPITGRLTVCSTVV